MIFKGVINKQAAPCPQTTMLPIPSFASNFVAIFMLCSSVVRLKRKGNYFMWIEIITFSLIQSFTFQLKANDCVWSNLFTNANEGRESKTKDSMYNIDLNVRSFFSGKKCTLYTGKYSKHFNLYGLRR